ncbi:uncharacterized protein [Montipora capricornis]
MSSSRTNRALEEASKAPSARARRLTITAVILLTLVVIVLISGVFLIHKVIANLEDEDAKRHHEASLTSNLTKRAITLQQQIKGKQKPISQQGKCERITIPLCKDLPYNMTMFPNYFNHTLQEEAALEVNQFFPLVKLNCADEIKFFLCSLYAPPCVHSKDSLPPCRSLCSRVRKGCEPLMKEYSFAWPKSMACEQFPEANGRAICLSRPNKTVQSSLLPDSSTGKCERITIPLCKDLPYNMTMFPNYFNHASQEEAALEVHQFFPLVEMNCAEDLRFFLCSLYAPPCLEHTNHLLPPCRSLCSSVRKGCEPLMKEYGFAWPKSMACEQFPEANGRAICLSRPNKTVQSSLLPDSSTGKCERITIPLCKDLPYNMTMFPNYFNHASQEEAALEVNQFFPLVKLNCADEIKFFLCSLYAPPCVHSKDSLPPCRSLCSRVRKGCEPLMKEHGFAWPKSMACEQFPEANGSAICLSRPNKTVQSSLLPDSSTGKCERITIPLCKDLPYNMTMFPNYFNHASQEEAALEVHQFFPLVEMNCAEDLRFFLCSLYAPPCLEHTNHLLPPCRSLCSSVRKGCEPLLKEHGFAWPKSMACEQFPEANVRAICLSRPNKTVQSSLLSDSSKGKCERITIPLCKDLPYNMTMFPNYFNHTLQEEAALEVHQFFPLVKLNCAEEIKFFLCSLYAPPCVHSKDSLPPCRSLCSRVRKGCELLMKEIGFAWPKSMACEQFPEANGRAICLSRPNKTVQSSLLPDSSTGKCERITIPLCKDLPYNMTMFPNYFNHASQEEAALEVHQFFPLVEMNCAEDLRFFLCSLYAPPCLEHTNPLLPPCRSLCSSVRKGCEPLMKEYGFAWPKSMACEQFPEANGRAICLSRPNKTVQSSLLSDSSKGKCERITIPLCKDLPYNMTMFPNYFNHTLQEEAALEVNQFFPLVKLNCADEIKFFLCSLYAPPCVHSKDSLPPCRSLCSRVRKGCEPLMKEYSFAWPKSMACEQFPEANGRAICLSRPNKTVQSSLLPDSSTGKCERITIPLCKDLPYNMTMFPNYFNHASQEEAALEVHQFFPLVEMNCAEDLRFFLCSLYAPPCLVHTNHLLPPCRSLCSSVRKGCEPVMKEYGFAWPKSMACEQFPEANGRAICLSRPNKTVQSSLLSDSSKGKCERITIPLCKDLPYNMTMFPNYFNHTLQEEAALEVNQFFPLVKLNCADEIKFFLCSLYAPPCVHSKDSLPPCRSLCSRVRKGCEPLMKEYGFAWPKSMACEQFPEANGSAICLSRPNKTVQSSLLSDSST